MKNVSAHLFLFPLSDSVAYQWGPGGGLITYEYPSDKRPDTSADVLSLGFITPSFDAVLVRIDSQPERNHDFLQLEIVSTCIIMAVEIGCKFACSIRLEARSLSTTTLDPRTSPWVILLPKSTMASTTWFASPERVPTRRFRLMTSRCISNTRKVRKCRCILPINLVHLSGCKLLHLHLTSRQPSSHRVQRPSQHPDWWHPGFQLQSHEQAISGGYCRSPL